MLKILMYLNTALITVALFIGAALQWARMFEKPVEENKDTENGKNT